jgi:predicted DNA-binding transcriptional regulator AlpA
MKNSQTCERESVAKFQFQKLLTEQSVADNVGLSVASVRRWRLLGKGPKYIKIGAAVRYRPEDLWAWLESQPAYAGQLGGNE